MTYVPPPQFNQRPGQQYVNAPHYGLATQALPEPSNKVAVFVLGLLSLVMCGLILGPIALIMSKKGRKEVREGRARPDGMLTAGFVCGLIGTIINTIALVVVIAFFAVIFASADAKWESPEILNAPMESEFMIPDVEVPETSTFDPKSE